MRNLLLFIFAAVLLLSCLVNSSNAQDIQSETALPASELLQAEPVYNLLKAVENSDFELYQSVWAEETLKMYGGTRKGWARIRRGHAKWFREELGRYRLEDLRFYFEKQYENGAGVLFIIYKDERRTGLHVIEEKGEWKIREM